MASKKHTTLYTIFNRNDPSPTASALRNHVYDSAVVFILGEQNFNKQHKENLRRFKTWISGSPKNHNKVGWPDDYWKKEWSWPSISEEQINFVFAENITNELIQSLQSDDIVDLTSGTKRQSANLIQIISNQKTGVNFYLQTRDGYTLDMCTGKISKNMSPLTFREQVWLSSGYIVDYTDSGSRIKGKKLIRAKKSVIRKKIEFDKRPIQEILGIKSQDFKHGYWLEDTTAHIMSTWPQITETYIGPRMINNSFARASGVAFFTLTNRIKYEEDYSRAFRGFNNQLKGIRKIEDFAEKREKESRFLVETEFDDNQRQLIIQCFHSVEFDAVAFDNNSGDIFACECKSSHSTTAGILGRINSITKLVFPTYGTPVLVNSGSKSVQRNGVNLISWPMLEDSKIVQRLQNGETLNYKSPDSSKDNPINKEMIKERKKIIPIEDRVNILRSTLEYVRFNPMPWPLFVEMLSSAGYGKVTGLYKGIRRKQYGKKLAGEMGFVINAADTPSMQAKLLQSVDWITWNDTSMKEVNTEKKITDEISNKSTEKIQVDENGIVEIINDYYQSSDLFTEIIIDSKLRTINIKSANPGRVIGPKGKHVKSVAEAIEKKLGMEFRIHIVK